MYGPPLPGTTRYTSGMDEYRPRPGDEHVEPLFAGLGVQDAPEAAEHPAPRGRASLPWVLAVAGIALAGAALVVALA